MRSSDLDYISHIPTIDPRLLGDLLKESTHHRVYEYGKDEILKVPRRRFNFLYSERSHLEADLAIIERYFPGLAVHTLVHSSENHDHHCIVQEKLLGYKVTPDTVKKMKDDFRTLFQQNSVLLKEKGASLDYLGGAGLEASWGKLFGGEDVPFFSNMTIIRQGKTYKIKLLDTELLRIYPPKLNLQDILRYLLSLGSFMISEFFLRIYFYSTVR